MKTAFLFPGQGAQYVGMGKDFYNLYPCSKEVFLEADSLLGEPLSKIIFEGPESLLKETKNAQLAIFVTSFAVLRAVEMVRPDLKPDVVAGLSLGEYTALAASGRASFKDTLFLVRERARFMNKACESSDGTMAAVLGLTGEEILSHLKEEPGVWVANFNAPGQTVISGTKEGVLRASSILKDKGAKRVLPLAVHGAFHSPLMKPAQEALAPFIRETKLVSSPIDLIMNVSGKSVSDLESIRLSLTSQVTHSVLWEQTIQLLQERKVERFLEIGCGKTLSGLNKKMGITSTLSIDKVGDLESLDAIT